MSIYCEYAETIPRDEQYPYLDHLFQGAAPLSVPLINGVVQIDIEGKPDAIGRMEVCREGDLISIKRQEKEKLQIECPTYPEPTYIRSLSKILYTPVDVLTLKKVNKDVALWDTGTVDIDEGNSQLFRDFLFIVYTNAQMKHHKQACTKPENIRLLNLL
jgi:hypothetical protein